MNDDPLSWWHTASLPLKIFMVIMAGFVLYVGFSIVRYLYQCRKGTAEDLGFDDPEDYP